MNRNLFLMLFSLILVGTGCAKRPGKGTEPTASLKHFQFAELDSLMASEQRPVAVFLHAEWCKYCRNMEQTTFQNSSVIKLLNSNYYFVSFDGEQKESVSFRNHEFNYSPTGANTGTHELAAALGKVDGELVYPTFVLLNPSYEIVFQHNAFLNGLELEKILVEGTK